MYEALGAFLILVLGLLILFRVYTHIALPKIWRSILWFLVIFGLVDGAYFIVTSRFPILFHIWSVAVLFILIMLVVAGI
jgi:hypothetical protein